MHGTYMSMKITGWKQKGKSFFESLSCTDSKDFNNENRNFQFYSNAIPIFDSRVKCAYFYRTVGRLYESIKIGSAIGVIETLNALQLF